MLCHGQAGVRPNVRTFTALITALGNAKQWDRALSTLRRMKSEPGQVSSPHSQACHISNSLMCSLWYA